MVLFTVVTPFSHKMAHYTSSFHITFTTRKALGLVTLGPYPKWYKIDHLTDLQAHGMMCHDAAHCEHIELLYSPFIIYKSIELKMVNAFKILIILISSYSLQ